MSREALEQAWRKDGTRFLARLALGESIDDIAALVPCTQSYARTCLEAALGKLPVVVEAAKAVIMKSKQPTVGISLKKKPLELFTRVTRIDESGQYQIVRMIRR